MEAKTTQPEEFLPLTEEDIDKLIFVLKHLLDISDEEVIDLDGLTEEDDLALGTGDLSHSECAHCGHALVFKPDPTGRTKVKCPGCGLESLIVGDAKNQSLGSSGETSYQRLPEDAKPLLSHTTDPRFLYEEGTGAGTRSILATFFQPFEAMYYQMPHECFVAFAPDQVLFLCLVRQSSVVQCLKISSQAQPDLFVLSADELGLDESSLDAEKIRKHATRVAKKLKKHPRVLGKCTSLTVVPVPAAVADEWSSALLQLEEDFPEDNRHRLSTALVSTQPGQDVQQMLMNPSSPHFEDFQALLALTAETSGVRFNGWTIESHVATRLSPEERRRLVGNDIAAIVFLEEGSFDPSALTEFGKMTQIFIIVQPFPAGQMKTFRLSYIAKRNIKRQGPNLRAGLYTAEEVMEVIWTKVINNYLSALRSSPLRRLFEKPKLDRMMSLVDRFEISKKSLAKVEVDSSGVELEKYVEIKSAKDLGRTLFLDQSLEEKEELFKGKLEKAFSAHAAALLPTAPTPTAAPSKRRKGKEKDKDKGEKEKEKKEEKEKEKKEEKEKEKKEEKEKEKDGGRWSGSLALEPLPLTPSDSKSAICSSCGAVAPLTCRQCQRPLCGGTACTKKIRSRRLQISGTAVVCETCYHSLAKEATLTRRNRAGSHPRIKA